MPRFAIVSDIHGSLPAFEAVLRDIDAAGVDCIVCLGDVVGYGPDPVACVELAEESCDAIVIGNHDEAAVEDIEEIGTFNEAALRSLEFTREALSEAHKARIRGWLRRWQVGPVQFTHAAFGDRRYAYVATPDAADDSLSAMPGRLGAVGHTHIPAVFSTLAGPRRADARCFQIATNGPVELPDTHRHHLNPGAVGQPRDRIPAAAWGLLDTTARTFEVRRCAYDIDSVCAHIRSVGLPEFLAERLRFGA